MKTPEQIRQRQHEIALEKEYHIKAYSRMGQIDMLSGDGHQARDAIARCQGQIEILNWVLNNG